MFSTIWHSGKGKIMYTVKKKNQRFPDIVGREGWTEQRQFLGQRNDSLWYDNGEYMHACVLSRFSPAQLFVILWTAACQNPLSMGILPARILEWFDMPSSRGSARPRDPTWVSCLSHCQVGSLPLAPPGKANDGDMSLLICPNPQNVKH